jgi:hypothetical protein
MPSHGWCALAIVPFIDLGQGAWKIRCLTARWSGQTHIYLTPLNPEICADRPLEPIQILSIEQLESLGEDLLNFGSLVESDALECIQSPRCNPKFLCHRLHSRKR